jgi:hypothetical protein
MAILAQGQNAHTSSTTGSDTDSQSADQPKAAPAVSPVPKSVVQYATLHAKYDWLSPKDWLETPFPDPGDTLFGETFGLREALAKHNIGFRVLSVNPGTYNLRDAPMAGYTGPATYNGQREQLFDGERPNAETVDYLFLTYNVPSLELQFVWVPGTIQSSWNRHGAI